MVKILLLEDDLVLLETLADELEDEGYSVDIAKHGKELLDLSCENSYHLYIFDINVPFIDGVTLLKELRESGDKTTTIFLTSKSTEVEKIEGFEAGCDDYLVKPFSLAELKLRVKVLLKRVYPEEQMVYGDIVLDKKHAKLTIANREVFLEQKALKILHLLLTHPNKILTIDEIIESVYREKIPSATVIRVHISKINTIFETKRVINIRGVGYRYEKA